MTNGTVTSKITNPIAYVSPGDLDVIDGAYAAHGGASQDSAGYLENLDTYFGYMGFTRGKDGNYRPIGVQNKGNSDTATKPLSDSMKVLEFSVISRILRQMYWRMRYHDNEGDPHKFNRLHERVRGLEAVLGYGSLADTDNYLAEFLEWDHKLINHWTEKTNLKTRGRVDLTGEEEDILTFRYTLYQLEFALAKQAEAFSEILFEKRDSDTDSASDIESQLEDRNVSTSDVWIPEFELTNAIGLYPYERQVDIIDQLTDKLEKHPSGCAILLEMLRTGVPFDPLALFKIAINHEQATFVFDAPGVLEKHDGGWRFRNSKDEASGETKRWIKAGPVIKDPVSENAGQAAGSTFSESDSDRTLTGRESTYRIEASTELGSKLAAIATRFATAVTAGLRDLQGETELEDWEKQKVRELQGYLAVITGSFIDSKKLNQRLESGQSIQEIVVDVPETRASGSNTGGALRKARKEFKSKARTNSLPELQDALSVVSSIQSQFGDVVGAQYENTFKDGIKAEVQQGFIKLPQGMDPQEFARRNPDWRSHRNELIEWQRRLTALDLLCSSLHLGFTVVDHARFAGAEEYDTTDMIEETTDLFDTLSSIAVDVDTLLATHYTKYESSFFVQECLGEVGGYYVDTVGIGLTIEDAYQSAEIGNVATAYKQAGEAVISAGVLAAGAYLGGVVGAVVTAVIELLTYLVTELFWDEITTLEQWVKATLFGTGFDNIKTTYDPFGIPLGTPDTATPHRSDAEGAERFTFFKWHESVTRQLVGYYNLVMGFDLPRFVYLGDNLRITLKNIAYGKPNSRIALCPIRKLSEKEYIVDPPYMSFVLKDGTQSVLVNHEGMYEMSTGTVDFDCRINRDVQSTVPKKEWVDDVWAFEAEHTYPGQNRPVVWPSKNPASTKGTIWGFEVIHMMAGLERQMARQLRQNVSIDRGQSLNLIENVPHPRTWKQPRGFEDYPLGYHKKA